MPDETGRIDELVKAGVPRVRALLATRTRALREARHVTSYGLARRADLHGTYLRQIEEGTRNPSLEQLVRLAAALELRTLDELIGPLPLEDVMRAEREEQQRRVPLGSQEASSASS